MINEILKDMAKIKKMMSHLKDGESGIDLKKVLKENFDYSDEETENMLGKIEEFKKRVASKLLGGQIKTQEDLLKEIRDSDVMPKERFDEIMKYIKERKEK